MSWVFIRHAGETRVGHIHAILSPAAATDGHELWPCVIIEAFDLTNSRHPHFGMPELIKVVAPRAAHLVVHTTDIFFIVNAQHNCIDSACSASGRRMRKQERLETEISQPIIEHTNDTHYVLNTHALHNAALIRKTLPRHLTKPEHYLEDRRAQHDKMAALLCTSQDSKRSKEADARKARSAAKNAAKELEGVVGDAAEGPRLPDVDVGFDKGDAMVIETVAVPADGA